MAAGSLYRVDTVLSAASRGSHVWFRHEQSILGEPKIEVYDIGASLIATISGLGDRPRGEYASRSLAIYWDCSGEASGSYTAALYINNVLRDERSFSINS